MLLIIAEAYSGYLFDLVWDSKALKLVKSPILFIFGGLGWFPG